MDFPQSEKPRTGEDLADLEAALKLLDDDLRTGDLGYRLRQFVNNLRYADVPGWKYLRAARMLLEPGLTQRQRQSAPYFLAIAANIGDDERVPMTKAQRKAKDFADEWAKRRKDATDGDDF